MTDLLLIEQQADGVTVLTFNRPEAHNALTLDMMRAFADAVANLAKDASLRAVILAGAGEEAFCSGGDLVELSGYPSADDGLAMITLMGDALLQLERLPVPVIAAINGYALGGGSEIALACDMRIADEKARMGFVQVKNGLTPGWGAGQRLLRLVGYARAMDLLVTGNTLNAPELLALGLVNQITNIGNARIQAVEYARGITKSSPNVIRSIKALLQAGLNQPYEAALQTERALFPSLWAAESHVKAVEAFINRPKKQ